MVHPGRFRLCHLVGQSLVQFGCLVALTCVSLGAELSSPADIAGRVDEHLSAGEFGSAIAAAVSAPEADQAALLNKIADVQKTSGDVESAIGTRRRSPRSEDRVRARLEQGGLAGGGQANFGQLITMIMQNIRGDHVKWEMVDGEGGTMTPFMSGVHVAPDGLVHRISREELSGQLSAIGVRARQADLNNDVAQQSSLRMVSLTRLEKAVAQRIEEGLPIPDTMAKLAGLSQLKYVFVYPESNEIVLAGPAAGWDYDQQGQPISRNDGRPTLQLEDLVTVLRTFAQGQADFGCSINTRDSGVKQLKEFVEASPTVRSAGDTGKFVNQLQKKLGRQDVVVWGVPSDSRVARTMVEADYRMKLIGIEKIDGGKDIPSYFDLLPLTQQAGSQGIDALRWWLTLQADGISHSEDKCAFELHGSSVLCQSENQKLAADGKKIPTGQSEATNRLFAEKFTTNYAKLAAKDPIFADLQNIFDLALCSAVIQHEHLSDKAVWNYGVFGPNGAYSPAHYAVPKEVDSVVNHRVYRKTDVVIQVAGGVTSNAMAMARDKNLNKTDAQLENVGTGAKAPQLPVGRWWWDSAN